jgi:hypothetical protein
MDTFATYSEQERDRRTSIRVEESGAVMVLVTGRHGEVIHSIERTIEPARAARLVGDVAAIVPDLADSSHGRCTIGFGQGSGQPALWSFEPEHAFGGLSDVGRRMKNLIAELVGGHRAEQRHTSSVSGPDRAGLTPGGFALWTGIFFAGHVGALLLAGLGAVVAAGVMSSLGWMEGMGPLALILGVVGGLLLVVSSAYFFIGRAHGRRYGSTSAVWQTALAAVALPAILGMLAGGEFSLSGISFFLPLVAKAGASTVTPE